mmetsp:Transcript_10702/g.33292  ORF Transcript_10702/g.33292 Transcript_10702/m.33292 type:complete len:326 (+) Transcript_10702:255-1232(+)
MRSSVPGPTQQAAALAAPHVGIQRGARVPVRPGLLAPASGTPLTLAHGPAWSARQARAGVQLRNAKAAARELLQGLRPQPCEPCPHSQAQQLPPAWRLRGPAVPLQALWGSWSPATAANLGRHQKHQRSGLAKRALPLPARGSRPCCRPPRPMVSHEGGRGARSPRPTPGTPFRGLQCGASAAWPRCCGGRERPRESLGRTVSVQRAASRQSLRLLVRETRLRPVRGWHWWSQLDSATCGRRASKAAGCAEVQRQQKRRVSSEAAAPAQRPGFPGAQRQQNDVCGAYGRGPLLPAGTAEHQVARLAEQGTEAFCMRFQPPEPTRM